MELFLAIRTRSELCSSLPRCSSRFHSCKHDGTFPRYTHTFGALLLTAAMLVKVPFVQARWNFSSLYAHVRSFAPHCRDARQGSIRASTMELFLAIRAKTPSCKRTGLISVTTCYDTYIHTLLYNADPAAGLTGQMIICKCQIFQIETEQFGTSYHS